MIYNTKTSVIARLKNDARFAGYTIVPEFARCDSDSIAVSVLAPSRAVEEFGGDAVSVLTFQFDFALGSSNASERLLDAIVDAYAGVVIDVDAYDEHGVVTSAAVARCTFDDTPFDVAGFYDAHDTYRTSIRWRVTVRNNQSSQ